ncbi:MAG: 16S rRNA (guanine(966)-N(2))-methyltransferase RsmD [Zetaproteobacteria bacterium]|nr:MAG: 16S rRNA (guanine(966)-N(2))-methyltransferase RsmD [Zetaproteobacteria bacterium]
MRITAGSLRGRVMQVPNINGLRPTPSKVRQALFNMLGDMDGLSFLDLFAGSGVMSIEALSRGAISAYSIESEHKACAAMKHIRASWHIDGWHIHQASLPQALPEQHFDVVYADPPYAQGVAEKIPQWLSQKNITFKTLVIEEASRANVAWLAEMMPIKQRKYGDTTLYFFDCSEL